MHSQSTKGQQTVLMIVNPFPPLSRVGASIRTVKFLQYADQTRTRFTVLTQDPYKPVFPLPLDSATLLDAIPKDVHVTSVRSKLRIPKVLLGDSGTAAQDKNRTAVGNTKKKSGWKRLLKNLLLFPDEDIFWALSAYNVGKELIRENKIAAIYVAAPPFSNLLLGYRLAMKLRTKLIVDLKDDWIEGSIRLGKPEAIQRIERYVERKIVQHADAILVPTKFGIQQMCSRYPEMPSAKLKYVPNGCDLSEFSLYENIQENELEKGKFYLVSGVGGLSRKYRDIQPFLESLSVLASRNESFRQCARVRLLGSNVFDDYGSTITDEKLTEVIQAFPALPRREYVQNLKLADVLLLFQFDNAQSSISGTLYEYWAMSGTPIVLVGGEGATKEMLLEKKLGYAFGRNEISEIAKCIESLFNSWQQGYAIRTSPAGDLSAFDRKEIARQFQSILVETIA